MDIASVSALVSAIGVIVGVILTIAELRKKHHGIPSDITLKT